MNPRTSRRSFLSAGIALPAAGMPLFQQPKGPAAPALEYRTLGKTGLKVTSVGFGCMITTDPAVISRALDLGINYYDTARFYQQGNNERMVGAALKDARQRIVLASKSLARVKAEAEQHLETSLRELGTDHLDIWHMHMRDEPGAITDDCLEVWTAAKKAGKIRFIGVSTHNPNNIADRVLSAGVFDVVQSTYNFTVGSNNDVTYRRFRDAGIGLVAMKVMAPAAAGRGRRGGAPATPAASPEKFLASLRWVLRNDMISVAIPSMTDMDQLEMNIQAMGRKYSPEDEKVLAALNEDIRPLYCRMCYRCAGQCPQGLPVADTLRYLSYSEFYGQYALGREHFQMLPAELRSIRCADCEQCQVRCPNGVQVQWRLMRAQQLFA